MPKGDPDPRLNPRALTAVPELVRRGVEEFNAGRFWHAHEDWEEAWHALRGAGQAEAADFLQGMILVTAGFENAKRGKESGFRRQTAKGLSMMRAHRGEGRGLGLAAEDAWIEAVTDTYLAACAHLRFEWWTAKGIEAPRIELAT